MKTVRLICSLCLLLLSLMAVFPSIAGIALAQEEQPSGDNITMITDYPTIEAFAGSSFSFYVELAYKGTKDRIFDLSATAPQGWEAYIAPVTDSTKRISSIRMTASFSGVTQGITVVASAPYWPLPDTGKYPITLKAVADNVTGTLQLFAKITATYVLDTVPANELYNTNTKAGEDNIFTIKVQNNGTGAIDKINFSSTKPEGWVIEFKPDKIDALMGVDERQIDVNIKPPPRTVAGDYMITLSTNGQQASAMDMSVRVTVETPTIWGWVGVVIIAIVVIGLFGIFMRFGRR